jgi:hypothetical protein
MVMVSRQSVTALAAHAAAALDLLEVGVRDSSVMQGIKDGEEFCAFLERGAAARGSEYFSAAGLAAHDYNNLVFLIPDGEKLRDQVPVMKRRLAQLRERITNVKSFENKEVEELRDYFFTLAELLPIYEGLHEKLLSGLPKRG